MEQAAYLVFDLAQHRAGVGIDDGLEAVLVLVALLRNQAVPFEKAVRAGEVGHIYGDVMAVVGRNGLCRFPEVERLAAVDADVGDRGAAVAFDARGGLHHVPIEAANAFRGARFDRDFHVRQPELHVAEARSGCVAAQAIAPRAGDGDVALRRRPAERGAGQPLLHTREAALQRVEVGHHDADVAAEDLRVAGREVELLAADVDPHVARTDHHVRVAGQPQAGHVERGGHPLVRHRDVDVFQRQQIADVLAAAVVAFRCRHDRPPSLARRGS